LFDQTGKSFRQRYSEVGTHPFLIGSLGMPKKLYDEEFSPEILQKLKRLDVLGRKNLAHLAILRYNVYTEAEAIVQSFQDERRENPVLETTSPETWLTAELMPAVQKIRAKVDIPEAILDAALQRYFCRAVQPVVDSTSDEQQLCTSVEAYLPAVKNLLINLYDRRKSLCQILRVPVSAYTLREALTARKPVSRREAIFLEGINSGWKNPRIARTLDDQRIKPRTYESYGKMLRSNAQDFYSLKTTIKTKYLDSVTPQTRRLAISREKSKV
jgi:hypothetical protein